MQRVLSPRINLLALPLSLWLRFEITCRSYCVGYADDGDGGNLLFKPINGENVWRPFIAAVSIVVFVIAIINNHSPSVWQQHNIGAASKSKKYDLSINSPDNWFSLENFFLHRTLAHDSLSICWLAKLNFCLISFFR